MAKICDVSLFFWLPVLLFFVSPPLSPVQGIHPQTLSCFLETFISLHLFSGPGYLPKDLCFYLPSHWMPWCCMVLFGFPLLNLHWSLCVFLPIRLLYSCICFVMWWPSLTPLFSLRFCWLKGSPPGIYWRSIQQKKGAFHLVSVVFRSKARLFGLAVSSKKLFPFELWWFKIVCLAYPRKMIV